ncbi:MAG: class I SAM-dependent methyltransferase [Bacteroidota bacterium]|nr:class I SAM-dependent methyltransferase [Bacteroidota bacterium]
MPAMDDMEEVYRRLQPDEIPWNIAEPPALLTQLLASGRILPCRMIEAGCGTGNHARVFAAHGFDVTGVDIAPTAVAIARRRTAAEGLDCRFVTADLTAVPPAITEKFDFAWEWEVLHHIAPVLRPAWMHNLHHLLNPGASYVSVCFSEEDEQFGTGKLRRTPIGTTLYFSSEAELRALFSRHFIVEELRTMRIPGRRGAHAVIHARLTRP